MSTGRILRIRLRHMSMRSILKYGKKSTIPSKRLMHFTIGFQTLERKSMTNTASWSDITIKSLRRSDFHERTDNRLDNNRSRDNNCISHNSWSVDFPTGNELFLGSPVVGSVVYPLDYRNNSYHHCRRNPHSFRDWCSAQQVISCLCVSKSLSNSMSVL